MPLRLVAALESLLQLQRMADREAEVPDERSDHAAALAEASQTSRWPVAN